MLSLAPGSPPEFWGCRRSSRSIWVGKPRKIPGAAWVWPLFMGLISLIKFVENVFSGICGDLGELVCSLWAS